MLRITRKLASAITLLFVLTLVLGCGSATNNDQGTSLTLLGFVGDDDDCGATTPNSTGASVSLGIDQEVAGGFVIAGIVVQNNLTAQFVRLERLFLDYHIPGAEIQPPSSSAVLGTTIDAAAPADGGGSVGARVCGETFVVPTEVFAWISLNRGHIPETPFTLEITARATGITQAGDRLTTNDIYYQVVFFTDNEIPPTVGDGGGEEGGVETEGETVETGDIAVDVPVDTSNDIINDVDGDGTALEPAL